MTGSFAVHDEVAFVPAASWEETRALDPAYPCCTFRGSVTAVRVRDGSVVWKTYLVDPPQMTGQTAAGTPTFGPSGAGIWSTPTVDERRGLLYVTTGDNYSHPAHCDERCRHRARARNRPYRVVAANDAERYLELLMLEPRRELSRGRRTGPRLRLLGDVGADAERHGHPRRGPEIRRRVRVRSGQRRQAAVAGPRRQRRNQRRRPMGHRERRPQRLCGSLGRRALAERERRGTGRLRAARPRRGRRPHGARPYQRQPRLVRAEHAVHAAALGLQPRAAGRGDRDVRTPCSRARSTAICARSQPPTGDCCGTSILRATTARSTASPPKAARSTAPARSIVDGMVFVNSGYPRFGGLPGNVLLAFGVAD